ncbi:hypothetical protein MN608_11368 [Microdochium nivale]|nr:hypothetical protein MN608_11368 [Microdochium nivale]
MTSTIVRNLFRRIRLSIFNFDRHVFLTVASQLHLAKNVQVLEWITYSNNVAKIFEWLECLEPKHDEEELEALARQFADACWVELIPGDTSISGLHADADLEKREMLVTALDDF